LPVPARYSDEGGVWSRIVQHWLDVNPKRSVLVVDISDPAYSL
jgi:isopenicillin N synthase-like dioxygenase